MLLAAGTVATGTGAAIATGAFSSLSADRTVTINTASDEDAVLSLVVSDEYAGLSAGGGDVIELNLDQLNHNATTRFDNALTIENNGSQRVELEIETDDELENIVEFFPRSAILEPDEAGDDDTEIITISVNLKSNTAPSNPSDITITATTTTS